MFAIDHDSQQCIRTRHGNKCLLCNASDGILPPYMIQELKSVNRATILSTQILIPDMGQDIVPDIGPCIVPDTENLTEHNVITSSIINDVIVVDRPEHYENGFILKL